MSKHLIFVPCRSNGTERVTFRSNDKELGSLIREVDGTYYFFPVGQGAWPGYALLEIAARLALLNNHQKEAIKMSKSIRRQIMKMLAVFTILLLAREILIILALARLITTIWG